MKVRIAETKQVEELTLIDRKTGIDCAQEIIGNHGYVGFELDEDERIYETDQANYNWWARFFSAQARADKALDQLEEDFGADAVGDVCYAAGSVDLEDQPAAILDAIERYRVEAKVE